MSPKLPSRTLRPDTPRKKIKQQRRKQLLEACVNCIAAEGLAETTIRKVAHAVGMSPGIVNFYFRSKDAMLRETLDCLLAEQTAAWKAALETHGTDDGPLETMRAVIAAMFLSRLASRKRLAAWAAFVAHAGAHPAFRLRLEAEAARWRETISPLLSQLSPEGPALTDLLLALIHGMWLSVFTGSIAPEKDALVDTCLAALEGWLPEATVTQARPAPKKPKKPAVPDEPPVVADLFAKAS